MSLPNISPTAHWRNSARHPRFFGIDARITLLILLFLFYIRLWTFLLALAGILFFTALEKLGFSLNVFFRWFRNQLAGRRKLAIPWWKR
jgi:intracellular multiplication protein IcmT